MQWLNYFFVIIVAAIAFALIINVNVVELKIRKISYKLKMILFIFIAIAFSFISSLLVNRMSFNKKFFYWFILFSISTLAIVSLELKNNL